MVNVVVPAVAPRLDLQRRQNGVDIWGVCGRKYTILYIVSLTNTYHQAMVEMGFKDDYEAGVLRLESDDGTTQAQSFAYNPVRPRRGDLNDELTNATTQTQLPLDLVVTRDVQDA